MKKLAAIFLLVMTPFQVFAGKYIEDSAGSSSDGFFNKIIAVIASIWALFFFIDSFSKWKERRSKGEKPRSMDDTMDWVFHLFAYGIVSIFACLPIFMTLKLIGAIDIIKESWFWIFIILFGLLTFLRRT